MKTGWRIFFGLLILAVLVYLLDKINFSEVWELIDEANNWYFLWAVVFSALGFLIYDFRSAYFIREIVNINYFFNLTVTFAGFFVNIITPGAQHGGDPVRAYFLGKKYKKPKSKLLGVILADKFYHMVVSFLFIVFSIIFVLTYIPLPIKLQIIFQVVLFLIFALLTWLFYISFSKTRFNIEAFLNRFHWVVPKNFLGKKKGQLAKILAKHFDHFSRTFKHVVKDKKLMTIGVVFSVAYWLLNLLSSYFLFLSFGEKISFLIVLVAINLANLIGLFSPSPGGVGLIEGSMILAYSALGVNLSIAFAVSLLSRMIYYFFSLVLGGAALIHLEHTVK